MFEFKKPVIDADGFVSTWDGCVWVVDGDTYLVKTNTGNVVEARVEVEEYASFYAVSDDDLLEDVEFVKQLDESSRFVLTMTVSGDLVHLLDRMDDAVTQANAPPSDT